MQAFIAFCCDTPRTCGAILRALHIESGVRGVEIGHGVLTLGVRTEYISSHDSPDYDYGLTVPASYVVAFCGLSSVICPCTQEGHFPSILIALLDLGMWSVEHYYALPKLSM